MWSWLIMGLIILTCTLCLVSVVQMELKKNFARIWLTMTFCCIAVTVWVLFSIPSLDMQKYAYQPRTPNIVLRELKLYEEKEHLPEQFSPGESEAMPSPAQIEQRAMVVDDLNIRDAADVNAPVLDTVAYGQIITILETPGDMDWVKIKTENGLTGWVAKRYLTLLPEE